MKECELSDEELNDIVCLNFGVCIIPADFLDHAYDLMEFTVLGKGTQNARIHHKGKYFYWRCYNNGVMGEAYETTLPRAITVAVLRATKLISGGVNPWDGKTINLGEINEKLYKNNKKLKKLKDNMNDFNPPVIGTDLEDN